jgi:hypothetical protein
MTKGSGVNDVVYTPRELALQIVEHFGPQGKVLDPCRGRGEWDHPLINKWCEISEGVDFFDWKENVDWIIGNPPWSIFTPFSEHALSLADNVVWLYHIPGLLTKRRIKDATKWGHTLKELIMIDTPQSPWPQSGFQVAVGHWSRGNGKMKLTDWRKM